MEKKKMAILDVSTGGDGGDFLDIVKYDARAGRMFRMDYDGEQKQQVDITKTFKAVFDFENIEVGFILFAAGQAPDFQMVKFGQSLPAKPSPNHKQGVRFCIKLAKECGGDIREISGTSGAFLRGINKLHDEYTAQLSANAGKLPVVTLADTLPITSGSGAKSSTNYEPVFSIVGWAPRPTDMDVLISRAEPAAAAPDLPPSTGATHAAPPQEAVAEDFG
jgi:hypothetical protein